LEFFVRNIFEICQHEVEKEEEKMAKSEASPFFIFFVFNSKCCIPGKGRYFVEEQGKIK
jgi:hypothetical protein